MEPKRILITGANGYLGRKVVDNLSKYNCDLYVSDLAFTKIPEDLKVAKVPALSENESIFEEMGKPDICIHLAWQDGFKHNSIKHMTELSRHFNFLKNMLNSGLKHLVVMGSMHEIGYWEGEVDENTPTNPMSLYGVAKDSLRRSLEILIREKYEDVVFQWLRGYYITGDDINNHSIFAKIIEAEQQGVQRFPFTSGKNKYDFLDIQEIAEDIALTVLQEDVTGIINCCSGKPISLGDKVEDFIKRNKYSIELEYGAFPDRPYDSPGIWGNPDKINQIRKTGVSDVYK